jgi:hypothetical protein
VSSNRLRRGVLDAALCVKVCQQLAAGWWFTPGIGETSGVSHANLGQGFRHIHIRDEDNWWMTSDILMRKGLAST